MIHRDSLPQSHVNPTRRNRSILSLIAQIILEHTPVAPIAVAPLPVFASCNHSAPTNWSVLMIEDSFGFGYVAQPSSENNAAMREGWVLISADLTMIEACQTRDGLRSGEIIIEDMVA